MLADKGQTFVDRSAEILDDLRVLLDPVAVRNPTAHQHVRIDLGEEFSRDSAGIRSYNPGPERLDNGDIVDAATAQHIRKLRQRRINHLDLVEWYLVIDQPLTQHDIDHAVDARHPNRLADKIGRLRVLDVLSR